MNTLLVGKAISDALCIAFKDLTLSEPQLVANLVWELPKHLNRLPPFGTVKLSAGGVFVHARPFVTCTPFPKPSPASVEIGDLLLIRTLVVRNEVVENRALLLQAKKTHSILSVPDNLNQWHLYEQWPKFTYAARSGSLAKKRRHIKEPDMYEAAKYLLIRSGPAARHWHGVCCADWLFHPNICIHNTAQPTKPEISRYRCFAGELLDFLVGNAGKVFIDPPSGTDGWHQVIHDLIAETTVKAQSVYMARADGKAGRSARGSGSFFMTSTNQSNFFLVANGKGSMDSNAPPEIPNEWPEGNDSGGISVIEVIVEQENG